MKWMTRFLPSTFDLLAFDLRPTYRPSTNLPKRGTASRSTIKEGKPAYGEQFLDAQSSGLLDANLGRVPILVVDKHHEIGQSKAIERFVARYCALTRQ